MLSLEIPRLIQSASGLAVSMRDISHAIRQRMKQCGLADIEIYAARIISSEQELAELIELVVVPETWMFRDREAFAAATSFVQENLARGHRPVRILCIPCATGEEPYSLAISLLEAGIAPDDVSIEGIDISRVAIERARRALFGNNAFRTRDLGFRDRHFRHTKQGYELHPRVRNMVAFRQGNLLAAGNFGVSPSYDMVFCRNLLIYFDGPTKQEAVRKLHRLLADDGLLFTGYTEKPLFFQRGFSSVPFPGAFALRKQSIVTQQAALEERIRVACRPMAAETASSSSAQVASCTMHVSQPMPAFGQAVALEEANSLADSGEYEQAASKYRECLEQSPNLEEAYLMLGILSERMGDAKTAEDCLRRVVYLNPDHYEALCHLALLANQRGNTVTADATRARAARVYQRQATQQAQQRQCGSR